MNRQIVLFSILFLFTNCRKLEIDCSATQQLDFCIRESGFSGNLITVKQGLKIVDSSYGFNTGGNPLKVSQPFRIGSLTKAFTAVAILQLKETGLLNLDDKLNRFFPTIKNADKITIYQLLTHTAGITDFERKDYNQLKTKENSFTALIEHIAAKKPDFEPGSKYSYSNAGYIILGAIIDKISPDGSYIAHLQNKIFNVLNMEQTGYTAYNKNILQLATSSEKDQDINYSMFISSGGLYSTTGNLEKWLQGLQSGILLNAENTKLLFTTNKSEYGGGWMMSTRFNRPIRWHTGSVPGYSSFIAWFAEENTYVIALSNKDEKLGPFVKSICEHIFK